MFTPTSLGMTKVIVDLSGQKFDLLTVLGPASKIPGKRGGYWLCKCECGEIRPLPSHYIKREEFFRSCGCHGKIGQTINYWTIKSKITVVEDSQNYYKCICKCGKEKDVAVGHILNGSSKSCGCAKKEKFGSLSKNKNHSLYTTWLNMRDRCNNENNKSYKNYGGRGISVCSRWDDFRLFVEDMGDRPDGATLDRIDSNGNYEPSNCRWATMSEQAVNRRTTVWIERGGQVLHLSEWARKYSVTNHTIRKWVRSKQWGTIVDKP